MPSALENHEAVAAAWQILANAGSGDLRIARVAAALRQVMAGVDFESAMGIEPLDASAVRLRWRDVALAAVAADYPPQASTAALAHLIADDLAAYSGAEWLEHRQAARRPPGRQGLLYAFLCVSRPLGWEMLRRHPAIAGIRAGGNTYCEVTSCGDGPSHHPPAVRRA